MKTKLSSLKYALWLLERRDYSTQDITQKLQRKEYPSEEIEKTLEKLQELKFLDDDRFTARFVENQHARGNVGNRMIYLKLLKKGINKEIIKKYLTTSDPDSISETALKWIKKQAKREVANKKAKLFSYLVGRGFEYTEIMLALDSEAVKEQLLD